PQCIFIHLCINTHLRTTRQHDLDPTVRLGNRRCQRRCGWRRFQRCGRGYLQLWGPRHDIDAHETRLRVGYRAEHAAQQLLAPRIEQAAADAVLAGHHDRRYPLLQTFCCDLALLFRRPTAAALATRDHLDAPITNARTIGRRSVLRIQHHCHHTVVLPQGRQVAQFSSRRAMCCRDIAYGRTHTPRSLRAIGRLEGRLLGNPEMTQPSDTPAHCPPLHPGKTSQSPPYPGIKRWKLAPLAEAKIACPSAQDRIQVLDHLGHADASRTPRQFLHPALEPGDRLRCDAAPRSPLVPYREAKEGAFPRTTNGTLCRIHLKLQPRLDETGDARHHPSTSLFAADIDITVVRVTYEPVATPLKLTIQLVQHQIREQRGERTALRRTLQAGLD